MIAQTVGICQCFQTILHKSFHFLKLFFRLGIAMQTKRYYNGFENQIMTGGALIEKLRVRYSLDPLNLLGNASVGSVYISYILYNDTKDYRKHLPVADAFSCFTEASKEISIRRK